MSDPAVFVENSVPSGQGAESPGASATGVSPPDQTDYRRLVIRGVRWNLLGVGSVQAMQIVVGLILVRLLSPREYGVAGMTLMFSSLALMMSDVQMGAALVQRREITETDRCTVFWTSAMIGVLLSVVGVALSWPLASFYQQPEVQPLFAVVSLSFVLLALQTTVSSLLQRDFQFRIINIRLTVGVVVGAIVGIVTAVLGGGAWALVLQQVASTTCGTILLWVYSTWRPRWLFSFKSLRDLGGFGLHLFGAQFLAYAKGNADNLLIGRFIGSAALGSYGVAYNLMFLPVQRLIIPIQETLFPAFSRWQDDTDRIGDAWLRVLRVIAWILVPAMLGFVVVAPDFTAVVMGHKWHRAVPIFQILSVVALSQCLSAVGTRLLAAVGRTRLVLGLAMFEAVLTISAFAVGLRWGIVGVSVCYLAVSTPIQFLDIFLQARAVGIRLSQVGRTLFGVAASTAIMLGGCAALRSVLVSAHVAPIVRLVVVAFAGIAIYVGACLLLERNVLREIKEARLMGRRAAAVASA